MNSYYNFRVLLIRLLLTTCFIAGTTSAPIDTEVDVNSGSETEGVNEEMLTSESKLNEIIKEEPRAMSIPFLSSIPNLLSGKETSGLPGLPGIPNLTAALNGAKLYAGAFQIFEFPKPKDLLGIFPTIPGLPNLLGEGNDPAST